MINEIPEAVPVTVLRTMPGDMLVLYFPNLMPEELMARIRQRIKALMPHIAGVIFQTTEESITVLRNGQDVPEEELQPVLVELPKDAPHV
jgi:hypothetical protein